MATELGSSALHGGMDSRAMPGAQTADEVAAVVLDAVENPRVDVYTTPAQAGMVRAFYDDLDAFAPLRSRSRARREPQGFQRHLERL